MGTLTRLAALAVITPLLLVGCLRPQASGPEPAASLYRDGPVGPFAPAYLRVHPLTHLDRNIDNTVSLLVHVQLRDRWSDLCKGVGTIQFQLHEPTGLGGAGLEVWTQTWEVDLNDLDKNAVFYDPATQTYRFSLQDLPGWIQQMAPGGDQSATGPGRFRIRARLTTPTPDGGETVLVGDLDVER